MIDLKYTFVWVTLFTLSKNHHNFGSKCQIIAIPTPYSFHGHPHIPLQRPNIAIGHHFHDIFALQHQTATQRSITLLFSPQHLERTLD
jgi:hypothetical protein